jgi:ankyrin repeat protein
MWGDQPNVARLLVEHGADPNSCHPMFRFHPLYVALEKGQLDLSQLLLKHGANPNARDYDGETLLHVSSRHSEPKVARGLLELGADVNVRDNRGHTPLQRVMGNEQLVQLLLQHGAKRT